MNPCIKTGCDVAFVDNPQEQMRADAYYFNGNVIFRVRPFVYNPGGNIDFFINGADYLGLPDTLIVPVNKVLLVTKSIQDMIAKYQPDLTGLLPMYEKPVYAPND